MPAPHRAARAELRARLAAERAELLCSLLGIEASALEGSPLVGEASVSDLLSTIAAREDSFAARVEESLGTPSLVSGAPGQQEGFEEALAACVGARTRFLDAFARVPDEVVFDATDDAAGATSPLSMATQCYWNDSSVSLRAGTWSRQECLGESVGPGSLLRAAVRAARKELLTTVALVPIGARGASAFEGGKSLPEIFRLLTGLEQMFLDALSGAGYPFSTTSRTQRRAGDDEWQRAWAELHITHSALLRLLDDLEDSSLASEIADGDDNRESVYLWARGCLLHDRWHAAHIRAGLALDWPDRLLR